MSTTRIEITPTDGWVEVVPTGSDFYIENASSIPVQIVIDTAVPAETSGYHTLGFKQTMTRSVAGAIYARSTYADAAAILVVSI